jgi:hypothetical protein
MKSIAGVFLTRDTAVRAIHRLQDIGVDAKQISFLAPENPDTQLGAVPTTETEAPGMGAALGAVVGGASGAALGLAAASLLVPGVGPVVAAGLAAMALFGTGGAVAGAAVGESMESSMDTGLPVDELFVYEDALRKGQTVVIAMVDDELADTGREEMRDAGALSVDAARDAWWSGMRAAEERTYQEEGKDFATDEMVYRRGFESALHRENRGHSFDESRQRLLEDNADCIDQECFRRGYERGIAYDRGVREKGDVRS